MSKKKYPNQVVVKFSNSDRRQVYPCRLTKTQVIIAVPTDSSSWEERFLLPGGEPWRSCSFSYADSYIDFDAEETSPAVREARNRQNEKKRRKQEAAREKRNARSREREFSLEMKRARSKIVARAVAWVETGDQRVADELSAAVQAFKKLRDRGPKPPVCSHRVCQMSLVCLYEEEAQDDS